MKPYVILRSKSQERMSIIAKRDKENSVREICATWDVPCAESARVTDDGMMRVRNDGGVSAEIPAKPLAEEAPIYEREAQKLTADYADDTDLQKEISALSAQSAADALKRLLADPTIASKNWVYRQYDHTVRTGTVVKPGSDAAVFYIREANKILAATTDCNSLYCALDPREGGRIAVAEAARNLTCSGARPLAVTDNLNFGNPYKPEKFGPVPRLNIELEIAVQNAVRDLIRLGLVRSAHDCGEGGLAVALAECCFDPNGSLGADIDFSGCTAEQDRIAGETPTSTAPKA